MSPLPQLLHETFWPPKLNFTTSTPMVDIEL